jgi:hypothetical protein
MNRALAALVLIALSTACGREFTRGPVSPSNTLPVQGSNASITITWNQALSSQIRGAAQHNHLPGPGGFAFLVQGSTVFLGWQAAPGNVSHYIIEAGSQTGQADIVVFSSGSAATGLSVTGVPTGIYYARVRAVLTDGQLTAVSNEIVVSVGGVCPGVVSPTSVAAPRTGSTLTLTVTTACAWTAVSHSPFVTVLSGASGTGNGVVSVLVAPNDGGSRSGTLSIAGQSVTITQGAATLHPAFELYDPASQGGATTECRINANPSTCILRSTSFTFGTTSIVHFSWVVQYTYGGESRTLTQAGIDPQLLLSDVCGLVSSTPEGAVQPLSVSLTVTDNAGSSATAVSGAFGQPPLNLRLFSCP